MAAMFLYLEHRDAFDAAFDQSSRPDVDAGSSDADESLSNVAGPDSDGSDVDQSQCEGQRRTADRQSGSDVDGFIGGRPSTRAETHGS